MVWVHGSVVETLTIMHKGPGSIPSTTGGGGYERWAMCIFDYFHIYVAKGVFSKVYKLKIIVGKVTIIACFQPWVKTRPA